MNKIGKRILAAAVASSVLVTPVFADPSVDDLKKSKESAQNEVSSLQTQLNTVVGKITELESQLSSKGEEIIQAQSDLEDAEAEEQKQYADMKVRIKYMYEAGDQSAVESLVGSEDFSDMVNKAEYVSNVHNYDRQKLQEYVETKQKISDLKDQLEEEQSQLESMQTEYESQESKLDNLIASKQAEVSDLDQQIEEAERKAAEEELKRQQEEAARQAAAEVAASSAANNTTTADNTLSSTGSSTTTTTPSNGGSSYDDSSSSDTSSSDDSSSSSSTGSATGSAIVSYATQFIGNPYVWGGTSLTNGADCSGFIMSVYAHFGYSLPHSSSALRSVGRGVSYAEAQPGDIICYSGHVAIYIGGGAIVHASNERDGIKISSNAAYTTILAVRRVV